ncbi:Uncharacterized protein APZ42_002487, partial [Daphnia magna]
VADQGPGAGRAPHGAEPRRRAHQPLAHRVRHPADPAQAARSRGHAPPAGEQDPEPDRRPQPRCAHLQSAPQDRRGLYPHRARHWLSDRAERVSLLAAAPASRRPAHRSLFRRSLGAVFAVIFLTWAALIARELIDIGLLQSRNGQAENQLWA